MKEKIPRKNISEVIRKEMTGLMQISDAEFNTIRKLVYTHFGINLTEQKKSLVVGRLQKLLKQLQFSSFEEYCDYLNKTPEALSELVNRISTNHTFFFREKEHFDFFIKSVLPDIKKQHQDTGNKDIRLWCAAAATGEEPYTIMMLIMQAFGMEYKSWDIGLLATDISEKALTTAIRGVYPTERIALVPPELKNKYLKQCGTDSWEVSPNLKKEIVYRRFNLMNKKLPFKKKMDTIFCRNVMIYFDKQTRDALVERLYDITAPGGYLFIGHSETLGRETSRWKYIMPAVYRKDF